MTYNIVSFRRELVRGSTVNGALVIEARLRLVRNLIKTHSEGGTTDGKRAKSCCNLTSIGTHQSFASPPHPQSVALSRLAPNPVFCPLFLYTTILNVMVKVITVGVMVIT